MIIMTDLDKLIGKVEKALEDQAQVVQAAKNAWQRAKSEEKVDLKAIWEAEIRKKQQIRQGWQSLIEKLPTAG